ncbi:DUF1028 domain-containing protein [Thermoproteota archaeon]
MTFTMVARCPRTKSLGIVTCTTGRAVGSAVPHVEEGVGAVATQATTNIFHGTNSLRLLRKGFSPKVVIKSTLSLDPNPERRQIFIIDSQGQTAAFTGEKNIDWKGYTEGKNFVAGGNNVDGPQVIEAMIRTFEELECDPLHKRLLYAVDSGEEAGGCKWPDHTAALLVVGIEEEMKLYERPQLDLRVDSSDKPTKDLIHYYEQYKAFIKERRERRRIN